MHHPAHGSQKEESRCRRCGGMNLIDNHPEHPYPIPPFKEPISFPVFPHPAMPSCLHSGYFLSSHFCILLFCRSNDFLYLCCVKIGISAWQKPPIENIIFSCLCTRLSLSSQMASRAFVSTTPPVEVSAPRCIGKR